MSSLRRKKLFLSAACLLLALVLVTTGTFAWLTKEQKADGTYAVLSDFEVEGILTFSGNTPDDAPVYEGDSVMVPVGLRENAPNYIGGMKYVVRYTGVSPACIRVRVLEQWVDTASNEIMSVNYLQYHVTGAAVDATPTGADKLPAAGPAGTNEVLAAAGKWVDNRSADYCYYYSVPLQPRYVTSLTEGGDAVPAGDRVIELTLFDQESGSTDTLLSGVDRDHTQLMLLIEVEAVQPNRIREFFGMDALPVEK